MHEDGRVGPRSELEVDTQIQDPTTVGARVKACRCIVAQVLPILRTCQIDHRPVDTEVLPHVPRRIQVNLLKGIGIRVQPRDDAIDQLAAPIVGRSQQQVDINVTVTNVGVITAGSPRARSRGPGSRCE